MTKLKVTVVVPVYNEEKVIGHFHERTRAVLDGMPDVEASLLYVADRSTDDTVGALRSLVDADGRTRALAMSSRFGHQMALLAGIEHSLDADAVVMMDGDLQHPPEVIPALIAAFRGGNDVVYTIRRDTEDVGHVRRLLGNLFYRALGALASVPINANAADFRLISRRVAEVIATGFQERNLFLRGLFSWIGFSQAAVEYVAERRFAGESKYSVSRMLKLAAAGVLSFSTKPLQTGLVVGVVFAGFAFALLAWAVVSYFIDRTIPSGWTTVVALSLLFSGVQLIVIGIIGAYIGGIYEEVKRRPRYIVEEVIARHDQAG